MATTTRQREGMAAAAAVKEIKGKVRLLVLSGEAKPGPAIGQALGPLGLNMAEFCKQFNASTSKMKPGIPVPVRLTAYKDRTFAFQTLTPPTTWFLKKCANIEKGSAKPVLEMVGKVTLKQIYEIAAIKQTDAHVSHIKLEHICRSIIGTARSMGVEVVMGKEPGKAKGAAPAASSAGSDKAANVKLAAETAAKPAGAAAKDSKGAKPADAKSAPAAKAAPAAKPAAAKPAAPADKGGDAKKPK